MSVSVHMKSQGAGFGFQVSGGVDTGQPAQVDMVLPGRLGGGDSWREEETVGGRRRQDPGGDHNLQQLHRNGGSIAVPSPSSGSAAEASGLRQEDEIVSVDHVDVAGLTHHQLVSTIRRVSPCV